MNWKNSNEFLRLKNETLSIAMALLPNSLYGAARFANFEGILSFSHLSRGGVNANHNVWTHSPSLARKNKTKNGERNRDVEWNFCRGKETDIALFLQVTRTRKNRKILILIELVDYSPKQDDHKQRILKKTHRNPPTTNHKPRPFKLVQVNIYFLRGRLRLLTVQKNPKTPSKFPKRLARTTNLAVKSREQ